MARYYLVCEFTPSQKVEGRALHYRRIYPRAPQGFLFHDTEGPLGVQDILRPLHRLSELFENATRALVIRHDANSIVATFSMSGFPTPVRIQKKPYVVESTDYEWLQEQKTMETWLIPAVNNPGEAPIVCSPDDIYNGCMELVRYTNSCPCALLSSGKCAEKYLYPQLPPGFTPVVMQSDYTVDTKLLKRVRYKTLADFTLTSGGLTTDKNFAKAVRPWDDHDFDVVSGRKHDLSVRGKSRYLREKFRLDTCGTCCFVSKDYNNNINDCGDIHSCTESTDEITAWGILFGWYKESGFGNMDGFTNKQRDYLIALAGSTTLTRIITPSRRTETTYGGFVRPGNRGPWQYRMVPTGGNLQRNIDFKSWADLRAHIPELPATLERKPVSSKTKLACAILGVLYTVYESYKPRYEVYSIEVSGKYVTASGASQRYESTSISLDTAGSAKHFYKEIWGYSFGTALNKGKRYLPTVWS